jgi:hypothetical protein
MPRRFLNNVERARLSQFPDEVTEADCIVYFILTPDDREFVGSRSGGDNRLGLSLLVCGLRYHCLRLGKWRMSKILCKSPFKLICNA